MADQSGKPAPAPAGAQTAGTAAEPSTAELLSRLSEQSAQLVRTELRLAQAEMQQKLKRAGLGAGLFGATGVVALYGVGALCTTVILALALILPAWLAALIVTVVLFAVAGVAALIGKKQISEATPAAPEQTIRNVKRDVETVKESRRDDTG